MGTPNKQLKKMKINVKSFWKGTIMYDMDMNQSQYDELDKYLNMPFIKDEHLSDIDDWKERLDNLESHYYIQQTEKGFYEFDHKESITSLLMINEMVKRKIIENDDMFGLLIAKHNLK